MKNIIAGSIIGTLGLSTVIMGGLYFAAERHMDKQDTQITDITRQRDTYYNDRADAEQREHEQQQLVTCYTAWGNMLADMIHKDAVWQYDLSGYAQAIDAANSQLATCESMPGDNDDNAA